jgi:hypothetical protein
MDSYVVRIYRRDKQMLTGLVECVEAHTRLPFHGAEELWAILTNAHIPSPQATVRRKTTVKE